MQPSKAEFVLKELSEDSAAMIIHSERRARYRPLLVATRPEEVDLFPVFPVETDSVKACVLFSHTGGSA